MKKYSKPNWTLYWPNIKIIFVEKWADKNCDKVSIKIK